MHFQDANLLNVCFVCSTTCSFGMPPTFLGPRYHEKEKKKKNKRKYFAMNPSCFNKAEASQQNYERKKTHTQQPIIVAILNWRVVVVVLMWQLVVLLVLGDDMMIYYYIITWILISYKPDRKIAAMMPCFHARKKALSLSPNSVKNLCASIINLFPQVFSLGAGLYNPTLLLPNDNAFRLHSFFKLPSMQLAGTLARATHTLLPTSKHHNYLPNFWFSRVIKIYE